MACCAKIGDKILLHPCEGLFSRSQGRGSCSTIPFRLGRELALGFFCGPVALS
jgi:hypothetical protein